MRKRPQKRDAAPVDGNAEADDGETGKDADKNAQQQKEALFLEAGIKGQMRQPAGQRRGAPSRLFAGFDLGRSAGGFAH
jgi:hypothetical protein